MSWVLRLFFVLLTGICLTTNPCFAKQIEYSLPPTCKEDLVLCSNPDEEAVCLVSNPRIHQELVSTKGETSNRYMPACDLESIPTCIDVLEKENSNLENVFLTCVEIVKCHLNEETNKIAMSCTGNKIAKCLGSDENPFCQDGISEATCAHGVAVCDYSNWEISSTNQ